jgi:hypothetical protein
MPKVELNIKNGVQKGPATDYSMLLEMKRRTTAVAVQNAKYDGVNPLSRGRQNIKPFIREGQLQSGSGPYGTTAVEFYKLGGPLALNAYKF